MALNQRLLVVMPAADGDPRRVVDDVVKTFSCPEWVGKEGVTAEVTPLNPENVRVEFTIPIADGNGVPLNSDLVELHAGIYRRLDVDYPLAAVSR